MPVDSESKSKLRQKFRLSLYDFKTHKKIRSIDFVLVKIYLLGALFLVLFTALILSIVYFTPLRRTVSGYGDIKKDKTYEQLLIQFSTLEEVIQTQEVYIENLKNRLVGNVAAMSDAPVNVQSSSEKIVPSERIAEDEKLRKELERKRILEKQNPPKKKEYNAFFAAPLKGTISAQFKPEEGHLGIDIVAPSNSPIKAVADGYVIVSDWTEAHGNVIGIYHKGSIVTFYKHNSSLLKKEGEIVHAGEAIAVIGNTGSLTDGPHLHFEIWSEGRPIDPSGQINFEF